MSFQRKLESSFFITTGSQPSFRWVGPLKAYYKYCIGYNTSMSSITLAEKLKFAGLKITQSRLKVLEILEKAQQHHLSAEAVYAILSKEKAEVALATVYRVLTQFEQVGLIKRHHFSQEHAFFELNQGTHHDHLVCTKCGHVQEFVDERIETFQREIAKTNHFEMTDHVLNIYGICQICQK